MTTLAIDQGTTSTRAMLVEQDGSMEVAYSAEHTQHYPEPGWVEHNALEIYGHIKTGIEAAATSAAVSAIGIDNQGESCLAWNAETLEPVSPVIVWQDTRTQAMIDEFIASGVEDTVKAHCGLPLDPYFSASKLRWIIDKVPEAKRLLKTGKLRLGTTDAFFLDRLAGRYVTDVTTASRTALMNISKAEWDPVLCEIFGVPIEILPEIVSTTGDFGGVKVNGQLLPITASVVDQQAALFGHGCREPGDCKFTFGTGAFGLVLTGTDLVEHSEHGLLPTVAWHINGRTPDYALDGAIYSACSALNWTRSLGLFDRYTEINAFEKGPAIDRNLAFVPALSGLACPHWDRTAAGSWIGLALDTTPMDMVQSVLEGVALRSVEVLDAMGAHISPSGALSVDGGLTKNPYFCQFLSDVSNREIRLPKSSELTALGTAMLGSGDTIVTEDDDFTTVYPDLGSSGRDCSERKARFAEALDRSRGWN